MPTVQSRFLQINGREIHVRVHNPDAQKTIVCWHGLARNCFDFDMIARELVPEYRVISPDTLGRGLSQWAKDPAKEYNYANYCDIATGICDHFELEQLSWIGTSMGGAIGIMLAADMLKNRIKALVVNDVGPEIPKKTLERILAYTTGEQPEFDTYSEFERYMVELYDAMGDRTKHEWFQLASRSLRRKQNGKLTAHFDPEMVQLPDENTPVADLWDTFSKVGCPILLMHGHLSDVLTGEIVQQMLELKPEMKVVTIPDCGHAPGLHRDHHIKPIVDFLAKR